MNTYKEFQGKSLDDAISEACAYYGVEREKLEIDIISDAKSGIFGLVGVKKARIRAGRVLPPDKISTLLEDARVADAPGDLSGGGAQSESGAAGPAALSQPDGLGKDRNARGRKGGPESRARDARAPGAERARSQGTLSGSAALSSGAARAGDSPRPPADRRKNGGQSEKTPGGERSFPSRPSSPGDDSVRGEAAPGNGKKHGRRQVDSADGQNRAEAGLSPQGQAEDAFPADAGREDLPEFSLENCDREELAAVTADVVRRLAEPIVGEVGCRVEILDSRVRVVIEGGEDPGLLVGREGHTLAAVQHLVTRIVARRIGGFLRLQIDSGNYRERQDDKLKEVALALAERAKSTRCPQSTRPLSAYQRRIVHLALEDDAAVQTHSKGDGAQRRVIIQPRRVAGRGREEEGSAADDSCGKKDAAPAADRGENGAARP
jgi:spoIIIJ-associated protein